jgi:TonB family protein
MKVVVKHAHKDPDSLGPRLVRSAVVHGILLLGLAGYSYLKGNVDRFGDPNPNGGGSVMIQPVNSIPIPSPRGPVQPVANDTQSQVPEPPKPDKVKPQPKKPPPPDPDAISLRSKKKDSAKKVEPVPTRVSKQPEPENQVYSQSGARTSSPMFTVQGSGGVGLGESNPFGDRFGYYAAAVRQQVARNWKTGEISLNTAPPVIVTFDVARNGSVSNIRFLQKSGNYQIDRSCERALIDASPLPTLPAGFERETAHIEFWFQLKK